MNINSFTSEKIALVGAGLVGSLLSIYLSRKGFAVDIFERRPDMRKEKISAGRSINLAISTRGIEALKRLGIDKEIMSKAIPMKGRMIHALDGELSFQPYGLTDNECINSISRATLNKALMDEAEKNQKVKIYFGHRCTGMDFQTGILQLMDEFKQMNLELEYKRVIGTDGSASALRQSMLKLPGYNCDQSLLGHGYKELHISPDSKQQFKLEPNALHIWPRGNFMLIALPNFEGSFTCTLFLPWEGETSFQHLSKEENILPFFMKYFPDAVPLIDNLIETFTNNPTGQMITIKTTPWNVGGQALLVGDAAHGIVPFYGQGMNCGFEDCTIIDQELENLISQSHRTENCWVEFFDKISNLRKIDSDAIADMAVENFIEMRDKVADKHFLMEKAVEKLLQKKFPGKYISRYALVTFSTLPYSVAFEVGKIDNEILQELCSNIDNPESVNFALAEKLIDQKLKPILSPYTDQLFSLTH